VALSDDNVLKNWQSGEGIHGSLKLQGLALGESLIPENAFSNNDKDGLGFDDDSTDSGKKRLTPHLFFLPSGEFLPFELCLYKVKSSALDGITDAARASQEKALLSSSSPQQVLSVCIEGHANGSLSRPQQSDMSWSDGEVKW